MKPGKLLILLFITGLPLASQAQHWISEQLSITKISAGIYQHSSFKDLKNYPRFPSHGLIIQDQSQALLIDTAWGNELTEQLIQYIEQQLKLDVRQAILTHSHDDRMGGIDVLKARKITTYAINATHQLAKQKNLSLPDQILKAQDQVRIQQKIVETYYPGPAHSLDNIVVWLPQEHVLFAGCMIRPLDSNSLGNTQDAFVAAWPDAIKQLETRYNPKTIVVSHGLSGDQALFEHTKKLLDQNLK